MSKQPRMTTQQYRAQAMKNMAEDEFQGQIIEYAVLRNWRLIHHRPALTEKGWRTAMQGDPGFPDLVLARRGFVIFAEVKTETGKLTPDQEKWLSDINGYTWDEGSHAEWNRVALEDLHEPGDPTQVGVLWRPSDWPTIERILR